MQVQENIYATLQKYWGFSEFRGHQEEVINSVLAGQDTLALMATGGGKSLCYQLPALLNEGICIVISPLIALMEDQERGLREKGISAESVHSGKSKKRQDEIFDNCIYGKVKFLFLSPEKLHSKIAQARIVQMQVSFFAIDEAHCISQWGHDFRPSYLKLNIIRDQFPEKTILALTATATDHVTSDIIKYLEFDASHKIFRSSFFRENISISVSKSSKKIDRIKQIVAKVQGSKIIYARNKRHCKEINQALIKLGVKSEIYHADIPIKLRQERQSQWLENQLECMVCTSAFGMGIDKADVRLVIHYDLPPSLEEYIQEIGRAGRDGNLSFTMLLYNNYDLEELEFHYEESTPSIAEIKKIYQDLCLHLRIPVGGGTGKSFNLNVEDFISKIGSNKIALKSALQTLEKNEYLATSSSFFTSDKFQIITGKTTLNGFLDKDTDIAKLVKYLLRNYEGLLYSYVSVSLEGIKRRYGWNREHLSHVIDQCIKQSILLYIHDDGSEKITFTNERLPIGNLSIPRKDLNAFYKAKKERFESVVDYVLNEECRATQLLAYFGEERAESCGVCDFCKGVFKTNYNKQEFNEARHQILSTLKNRSIKLDILLGLWPWNKQARLKSILQALVDEGAIIYENKHFKIPARK